MIPAEVILKEAKRRGSFYIYEERIIAERVERLKKDFPGAGFLYSMKANPAPAVVAEIVESGFGIDAASLGEVMKSIGHGVPKEKVMYSAPGKSYEDIEAALPYSVVVADSVSEVDRINEAAGRLGIKALIGLRINPDFTFDSEKGGTPQKFGIDEEQALRDLGKWSAYENIEIIGIHVHLRSQELRVELIERYYEKLFKCAAVFSENLGRPLKFLNLGSGIGIPFAPGEKEVDTKRLGETVSGLMKIYSEKLVGTRVIIETGRFVTGKCGTYCMKVLDRKISRGKIFIILSSTLNGFARPAYEAIVRKYSRDRRPEPLEPFFTVNDAFEYIALTDSKEMETVTLAGNLCTSSDIIAADILMPKMMPGDVLAVTNAGCYSSSFSPYAFASMKKPAELFLKEDGTVTET